MKKILSLIILFSLTLHVSAQTMKDIISNMPDSITPLLTKNNRLNLMDYIEAGEKAVEKNRLVGETEMTHLSATRCVIKMTSSSTYDFKLLQSPEPAIGVIITLRSDKTLASIIRYYSLDWKLTKTVTPAEFTECKWKDDSEEMERKTYNTLELDSSKFEK